MESGQSIKRLFSWEALDSRGNPTVACAVTLAGADPVAAIVPVGASTGRHEARELRDLEQRRGGRGVRRAVAAINGELASSMCNGTKYDQRLLDARLRELDRSPDLSRLGANSVLAVSLGFAIATARASHLDLYRSIAMEPEQAPLLPMPMINILSGGAHAAGALDIQDVLIVPIGARSFSESIELAVEVRRATAELARRDGHQADLVADEGGLAPRMRSNREAIELVVRGVDAAGLDALSDVAVAIDVAANQFFSDGRYDLRSEHRSADADGWIAEVIDWIQDYPIVSIEDPLSDDDWSGWRQLTAALAGRIQVLGDDLFATNPERLATGVAGEVANAILIKPNQIGTVTGAQDVVRLAQRAGYATVISARSGDTEDSWLADFAVGWRTGQIKVGSLARSERTAKWNRLLQIEAELGSATEFAGGQVLQPRSARS